MTSCSRFVLRRRRLRCLGVRVDRPGAPVACVEASASPDGRRSGRAPDPVPAGRAASRTIQAADQYRHRTDQRCQAHIARHGGQPSAGRGRERVARREASAGGARTPRPARRRGRSRRGSRPRRRSRGERAAEAWVGEERRAAQRSGPGRQRRQGSERPAPAQATRIAVSPMSPVIGEIRTGAPEPSARGDGAMAAVGDDEGGERHQLAVAQPVDQDGVVGDRDRALGADPVGGGHDADRVIGERRQRGADQVVARSRGRCSGRPGLEARHPAAVRCRGGGPRRSSARSPFTEAGQARGYSSCG